MIVTDTIYIKVTGNAGTATTISEIVYDPKRAGAPIYKLGNGLNCTKAHLYMCYTLTNPNP